LLFTVFRLKYYELEKVEGKEEPKYIYLLINGKADYIWVSKVADGL